MQLHWLPVSERVQFKVFLSNRRDLEPNPELWRERQRC